MSIQSMNVSQLSIYPVKSVKGIDIAHMELRPTGPNFDRRWMVIDENHQFLTQRQHPRMCLITSSMQQGVLTLSADNATSIVIPNTNNSVVSVTVWEDTVNAQDCGDRAAEWLSDFLGIKCRLVYMPDSTQRKVDIEFAHNNEIVSFADAFPLLIISQASLDNLNSKLPAPVGMDRFRPNIVISGCEPHAEDQWTSIKMGTVTLSLVKLCSRCAIPSVIPASAERDTTINRTLAQYRRFDGKIYFGNNALYEQTGAISIGDKIEVISSST